MKKLYYKVFGLLFLSAMLLKTEPGQAEPLCSVTLSNGKTVDLSYLCGKSNPMSGKSNPMNSIPLIDLNAPSPVVLIGSPTPSELWNTLPDLKAPPEAGQTEPMPPSANPSADPIQPTNSSF
ncbi:MAG: hypothetical protein ACKO7R_12265 [Pseudanabaena sp.]